MRRRCALALVGLAFLALSAGCTGFGSDIDRERLAENATYDWNTSATATVAVEGNEYRAVYDLSNGSAVEVFGRDALGSEQVVQVSAVQFRYPNGTVVGVSAVNVTVEGSRVVVAPPADVGKLAFSAPAEPKFVSLPVTVPGSYEVVLPPGMRVGNVLFGDVSPGGYESSVADDRVHLHWEDLDGETIVVRSYLDRDLYIFGGLVGLLAVVSVGGLLFFRLQLSRLADRREEAGLDVEDDDSGGGGPPLR